ncbi:pyridoxal phosphate-dependent aminotransferase [Maribacter sp. HTCC2170]|uniref:pyridoxal phosphate-dependent aminotransferase n=1 Tax=Maribacter sp. (strain HTCC2170 / KCCM 42371) TaxID=313603 RepID=UPI00006AFD9E|nr:histidinol-phosphate transaminase [Maribacter sp. HTCC2170]EAR01520.1 histidinol-phosphate aminotransferase [Maribacter sp. HTCC2170]
MRNLDRRNWLKTVGLSGSFALLGGFDVMAFENSKQFLYEGDVARLNANENPYGPSPLVRKTIADNFDVGCRYPFRTLASLVKMIAAKEGVDKNHVVITGGSTEGLKAAGLTFGGFGEGELIAADPTFQSMLRYAETFGSKVHRVPVNAKMEHDLDAMASKINSKTKLIFICNPNNPTGTLLDRNKLIDFCKSHDKKAVIFSDEAYYDFIMEPDYPSMIELVKAGRNVIVSKTFSKVYGLAGLRVGYLIARPDIATKLKASVMANTNTLAIEAAKTAIKDDEFYKFSLLNNVEGKTHIYETLDELGLEYIKSHTNFIFFKTGRHINDMLTTFQKEGVLIGRPFPPFYDWARISTGKMEDVKRFTTALKKIIG